MNIQNSIRKSSIDIPVIALVVTVMLPVFPVMATEAPPAIKGDNVSQDDSEALERQARDELSKEIVKEAADAATATQSVLKALHNNQPKQALAALEVASGNLHVLLARDPSLGLLPIDYKIQVFEGITNPETIKRLEDELEDLVEDKHYQTARPIMNSLVDEIRVTTVYLPLATYPAAIDRIAPLIDAGNFDQAKQEIYNTLNSLVSTEEITPLSIIRAEQKLIEAFQIEGEADLSSQITKNKIGNLLKEANQNVEVAQLLGYGSKKDYSVLYDSMDDLKESIGTSGFKGEWSKVKKYLSAFKNKIIHPRG